MSYCLLVKEMLLESFVHTDAESERSTKRK